MPSFREEASAAAEALSRLNREADKTAKGEASRERERERSFAAAALGLVGGVGGVARGLAPAAQVFGASGNFDQAAEVAASSVIEGLARTSVGQFLGGLAGVRPRINAKVSAREQVIDELSPLAAFNAPLDDGFVQRLIDVRVAQQERVEQLKTSIVAKTPVTPDDIYSDVASGNLGESLDNFAAAIRDFKAFVETLPFVGRGGGQ